MYKIRGGTTLMSSSEKTCEKCIYCNKQLDIPMDTPVEHREHYLRGCGQLCEACHAELMRSDAAEKK